ncbi:unnamed protein product [Fusarium graminearum]|nr:unnamed protein product [Fusarium graminearum]
MANPLYIYCTICGMTLGDDDCIVYYGPGWGDAVSPFLNISDQEVTRYEAVAESHYGKAILSTGFVTYPPEKHNLYGQILDRAAPTAESSNDWADGESRFIPEIPHAETGVRSLDGYYVPRSCLLRTGDEWEGWWDEDPFDILDLTADLMTNLERLEPTPNSMFRNLFELLPNEIKNHVCSYLQDEELSLDCTYLMPQFMWAGMFFRIAFLWDLDVKVVYKKTGSSKVDLEKWNWEKLTRQVMSRAESSLNAKSGVKESAWDYSKVELHVPGGLANRRRIWQVLEEMLPSTAVWEGPNEPYTDAMLELAHNEVGGPINPW